MRALKNMIPRRRSVRSYQEQRVDEALMAQIRSFMEGLEPLLPGRRPEALIIETAQANYLQRWKNPQFLALLSDDTEDGLVNVGFMYQQLDLFLQSKGLGSCWVGLGWLHDDVPVPEGMKLAVMMAFGVPDGAAERSGAQDFRRKPMAEVADAADDRLEPLRIAPSATNSQPWYVTHEGDVLHLWREELGRIKQRTHRRMNLVDTGIALAHLYVAFPDTFRFERRDPAPELAGRIYMGSVTL